MAWRRDDGPGRVSAPARVRVYVPTLVGGPRLDACLASLAAQSTPAEVVVIDNSGGAGTIAPDGALVVRPQRNRGFGPAINLAVREHPARLLIFANDDAIYGERFVEALVAEAPVAAGVLSMARRPELIDSAGVVVDTTLLALDHLCGEPVAAAGSAQPPLGPTGAAALVSHEAFARAGGFDERLFAYLDDVDLALRLRACGWTTRLAADALGVHTGSATLGAGSARKHALMGFARGYMLRRYGVLGQPRRAARALVGEAVLVAGGMRTDRTVAGVTGRVRGWHAARGLTRRPIPPGSTLGLSALEALDRRRRQRLVRGAGEQRDELTPDPPG